MKMISNFKNKWFPDFPPWENFIHNLIGIAEQNATGTQYLYYYIRATDTAMEAYNNSH